MLDTDKARDDLQDILDKKEYQVYYNDSRSLIGTWWENAKQWMAEQLEKLIPSSETASRLSGPIVIAIMVLVILLLAITAFFLIRNLRRNRLLRDQKPLKSIQEMNWTYQQHVIEAKRQEAVENFTSATRHLFLALLLYFHEKGWLEARRWKTNWDYYEELRKVNKQSADQFFDLASYFDEVTYGERMVQKEAFLTFQSGVMNWLKEEEGPDGRRQESL